MRGCGFFFGDFSLLGLCLWGGFGPKSTERVDKVLASSGRRTMKKANDLQMNYEDSVI
jgi:hypothetical protein